MKCKNCGTEFEEGVFCPECGMRIESELRPEEQIVVGAECAKEEEERKVKEKETRELELIRNKTEQDRLAVEKAKQEAITAQAKLEQEKLAKEAREAENIAREKAERERWVNEQEKQNKKIENEGKAMSILSLIFGIVSIVTMGCFFIPEILGIVFAFLGKKQGKMLGMSKAGLVCSIISIVIVVAVIMFAF